MTRQVSNGQMRCSKCQQDKPLTDFKLRSNGRLHSWCKHCKRAHDKIAYRKVVVSEVTHERA